jgi:hypothetical protein
LIHSFSQTQPIAFSLADTLVSITATTTVTATTASATINTNTINTNTNTTAAYVAANRYQPVNGFCRLFVNCNEAGRVAPNNGGFAMMRDGFVPV